MKKITIRFLMIGGTAITLNGLLILNIYAFQWMIDFLTGYQLKKAFIWLSLYFVNLLLISALKYCNTVSLGKMEDYIETEYSKELLLKIASLQYKCFETKTVLPKIHLVWTEMIRRYTGLGRMINSVISLVVSFVGVFFYLVKVSWILPLIMTMILIPSVWLMIIAERKELNSTEAFWGNYRKQRLYSNQIVSREYAKEERIFNTYPILSEYWKKTLQDFHHAQLFSNLKERFSIGIISLFQFVLVTLLVVGLFPKVSAGIISLGFLASAANSLWRIVGDLEGQVYSILNYGGRFVNWNKNKQIIEALPEDQNRGIHINSIESIEFKDVWFCYPESEAYVLKGVSFKLEKSKKYALVGENGCGKSTIIKILLGLLQPEKGQVLINGIDADSINQKDRFRLFETVFQDYVKYNLSIRDNLSMAMIDKEHVDEPCLRIVQKVFPELMEKWPQGLDTKLGLIDEQGIDLSGGEWQKVAIIRAILKNQDWAIFDEPTASLDPLTEISVYHTLMEELKNKTSIIVTHRLGLVRFVDEIIAIKEGKIIGKGSHTTLMKECEYYEEMFNASANWFESEKS